MSKGKGLLKKPWFFPLLVVLVAAGLLLLSRRGFPPLPADADHAGLTANGACSRCHSPAGPSPLGGDHPPKEQCLTCHKT